MFQMKSYLSLIHIFLDEEGTEPAAEPAAAVPKPSSRFSDLKFGENYDISQDTDEEPGFFKKKRSER